MDWPALIAAASKRRPAPLKAEHCFGAFKTNGWRPVKLRVEGGDEYAVKGLWRSGLLTHDGLPPGRTMFNEHAAGRLGTLMRAPVPEVGLVDVPQQLIDRHTDVMQHLRAGFAHGSRFIDNCVVAQPKHQMHRPIEGQNRPRFASLAIFFGWAGAIEGAPINDAEFLYDQNSDDVYGLDFGNFFGGPNWKDLPALSSKAAPNGWIVDGCKLTHEELANACEHLHAVTPEQIAEAVTAPPDEWGVTSNERVELARLLHVRQEELVRQVSVP